MFARQGLPHRWCPEAVNLIVNNDHFVPHRGGQSQEDFLQLLTRDHEDRIDGIENKVPKLMIAVRNDGR